VYVAVDSVTLPLEPVFSVVFFRNRIKESAENTDERICGVEDVQGVMNTDKVGTSSEN
jgi:hypothetical protein